MPPFKGPEWEHVCTLGQKGQNYKMECKYCKLKFSGGAPRIREHFIRRNPSVGVAACKADPAEIEDVVTAMAEIDDAQKEKEQHATKKRQLDRNTASMSAASEAAASTQLTMDTCKKAVTKAYVDAAVARFIYGTGTLQHALAPYGTLHGHPPARFIYGTGT